MLWVRPSIAAARRGANGVDIVGTAIAMICLWSVRAKGGGDRNGRTMQQH